MSLKIANLRLELDEPEAALSEKLSARLGVRPEEITRWRILRKSLDARLHGDLHFIYAAEVEVELPEGATRAAGEILGPDVEPYLPEHFAWPLPGSRPLQR